MSNFLLRCLAAPGPIPLSACPLHGAPMDRRSLLDTVTTLSVSGRFDFFLCFVFFLWNIGVCCSCYKISLVSSYDWPNHWLGPSFFLWNKWFILFPIRCLLLAPDRNPATKKSPAPPLLKKKHCRKLSWTCAPSARCTVSSKLYVHIVFIAIVGQLAHVHMQLCLISVAAIWINWRAKSFCIYWLCNQWVVQICNKVG